MSTIQNRQRTAEETVKLGESDRQRDRKSESEDLCLTEELSEAVFLTSSDSVDTVLAAHSKHN